MRTDASRHRDRELKVKREAIQHSSGGFASRLRGYVEPAFAGRSAFDVDAALGSLPRNDATGMVANSASSATKSASALRRQTRL
jgi:hypothetical protein